MYKEAFKGRGGFRSGSGFTGNKNDPAHKRAIRSGIFFGGIMGVLSYLQSKSKSIFSLIIPMIVYGIIFGILMYILFASSQKVNEKILAATSK